jgi:glyoxylase-like metal-dependent hydrolase (beta-lactamase superfamily II)
VPSTLAGVIPPLADARTLIDDGQEIFPGVHALLAPGHTPGHTAYVITSPAGRLIALGDAFHTPAQLPHPEWPSLPDVDSAAVIASRRRLIAELEQPGTVGFACHFGDQAFGRVVRDSAGLPSWEPIATSLVAPPPRSVTD